MNKNTGFTDFVYRNLKFGVRKVKQLVITSDGKSSGMHLITQFAENGVICNAA